MLAILRRALGWYDDRLVRYPYLTQILLNGPLWAAGDLSAQALENKSDHIDWARVGRFTAYGYGVAGPLYTWWYLYIERRWLHLKLANKFRQYVTAKVVTDQFLFEPFYLLQFFTTMGVMQRWNAKQIGDSVRENYLTTFAVNTAVWPALQVANFVYVPARFQALYVNVMSLGWVSFLSWITNRGAEVRGDKFTELGGP